MEERRTMRRFHLKLLCVITPMDRQAGRFQEWMTSNISSGGAYLNSGQPLPVGTCLRIQVFIPSRGRSVSDARTGACVSLLGEVVRTDANAMAVEFDDQYRISRMEERAISVQSGVRKVDARDDDPVYPIESTRPVPAPA